MIAMLAFVLLVTAQGLTDDGIGKDHPRGLRKPPLQVRVGGWVLFWLGNANI